MTIPKLPQFGKGRPMVSSLDQFKKPGALFRYFWAAQAVKDEGLKTVIDAACGSGYGSWVLCELGGAERVLGLDEDEGALEVANAFWGRQEVTFEKTDILKFAKPKWDLEAVVSLETIEHIDEPREFLKRFRDWAPTLIATVPDQDIEPFDQVRFPFHFRHYTQTQFEKLLREFYDEVEIIDRGVSWTTLPYAKEFLSKMEERARVIAARKLRGNIRVIARSN